ncbi:ropporin-1-like protein isoform X2 [Austrofundulus limnaeus]|nr:PREDICTED: ropporin-1-like protein isoform X2 [Austrofundulus limnaeus]
MPLPDTLYCSEQIIIPPELPDILKHFTKAAIRAQPCDLLAWSSAYFHALAKGESLTVKEKNVTQTDSGLTPGLLKILHQQLSPMQTCSREELQDKWKGQGLPAEQLETLLLVGSFGTEIDWMEFFAVGCGDLGGTLLTSLKFACEILTDDEEGGPARIPFDTFVRLYTYLARRDADLSQDSIDSFLNDLRQQAELQDGMIEPLDFMHRDDVDSAPAGSPVVSRTSSRAEK